MSYDISVHAPGCPHCGCGGAWLANENVTWNVSPIVNRVFDASGLPKQTREDGRGGYTWWRLEDVRLADALPYLEKALAELERPERQEEWGALEAERCHGWGSRDCVRRVLSALIKAGRTNSDAIINVRG